MSSIDPDRHFIADDHYDEAADIQALDRSDLDAPTWLLIWRRFLRHKLGAISAAYLLVVYLALPFIGFLAPYHYAVRDDDHILAPPQPLRFWDQSGDYIGLHTYPTTEKFNEETFQIDSIVDWTTPQKIPFFTSCGADYRMFGLFESNFRLICPPKGGTLFIFGTDRLGRDLHSRIMYGAQLSLTVGLIGVAVSFAIGLTLGGSPAISAALRTVSPCARWRSPAPCRSCRYGWRFPPPFRRTGGRFRCSSSSPSSLVFWTGQASPAPCAQNSSR